jgi:hypothetical protein
METQTRKYLYNHTSPETAYVVDGYPWGFRLRTQIRYWIETSKAKNGGQRFCSQTVNPKTGKWCAPKKSTYFPIMVMFLDEKEHVQYCCLRMNDDEQHINKFKETHLANLDDFQKQSLKEIIAYEKVMRNVTFEIVRSEPVSLFSKDPEEVAKRERLAKEREEREKQREESFKNINKAIAYELRKVVL